MNCDPELPISFFANMKTSSKIYHPMNSLKRLSQSIARRALLLALVLSAPLAISAAETGKTFATAEEAVSALVAAASADDTNALGIIFGPAAADLLNPDRVQATNDLGEFVSAFNQANRIVRESDSKCVLEVGNDPWPFPVPLVKQDGRWFFDTAAGKEELLNRRIGRNERLALESVRAYVEAQREYAMKDRDGDEVLEYAQKFLSTPGKKDGLYWPPDLDGEVSPLGPLVARRRLRVTGENSREAGCGAAAVPRLFLQDPHPPGQVSTSGEIQLHHQRKDDRRLRARGVAC